MPVLLKHKIGQTKIVKPENKQVANKVITVYTFNGGPSIDKWHSFLKDAELAFRENGIAPGGQIYEDQINGSDYIYYRNDADENGEYVEDAYNFLYKVVDHIPLSNLNMAELAADLKKNRNVVGCIVKLKETENCELHVLTNNNWASQKFNVNELQDLENKDKNQSIIISPIANREAYLQLVVPQLNKSIPSTNNVSKAPDPFKDIDMNQLLEAGKTQSRNL